MWTSHKNVLTLIFPIIFQIWPTILCKVHSIFTYTGSLRHTYPFRPGDLWHVILTPTLYSDILKNIWRSSLVIFHLFFLFFHHSTLQTVCPKTVLGIGPIRCRKGRWLIPLPNLVTTPPARWPHSVSCSFKTDFFFVPLQWANKASVFRGN